VSFKRIGDVAARLIADPVKLQAAAHVALRDEQKSGARQSSAVTAKREEEAPRGPSTGADGTKLRLVVDNGWRRDYRRPKGSPSPALRHPLSVVGGHQRTIPS
jgi:hypothetical protein